MGYQDGDEILLTEVLSRVLFENITIYEGAVSKSITLDGHKTETWMPKTVSLENASYRNFSKGKLRYRCKPDLYLRPGDVANINDDSFTVESITYSVSPELETYEIAE
jgi:5-methylcytosine-specific restriction endonuclease McrBC regulatory subunit McrC